MYIVGVLFSISSGSFKVIPPLIMYISIRNQHCGGWFRGMYMYYNSNDYVTMMSSSLQVVWYSRSERPRSVIIDNGDLHYVIKEGLIRLTQYTVYVYAFNSRGKGSDSQRVNITTDAVGK